MTRILLFDAYTGGHHLEYADRVRSMLPKVDEDIEVSFLAPSREPAYSNYFDPEEIEYLYDPAYDLEAHMSSDAVATRESLVRDTVTFCSDEGFDVLHFLMLDDLVREVHREIAKSGPGFKTTGWIIGGFFNERSVMNQATYRLLRSRIGPLVEPLMPELLSKVRVYRNDVYIYRMMKFDTLDHLFVPNSPAKEYLAALDADFAADHVRVVPDPIELHFETGAEKSTAREQLDLPNDRPMLLFFGGLREDKGIRVVLEALKQYEGEDFLMLIVGSEDDVTEADLERTAKESTVDVRYHTEFVPDEELPLYFRATDCVLTAHLRKFGRRVPSNVFQKAAGAGRPVISPDFGIFKDRVDQWNLGVTFEPESPESLANVMAEFAENPNDIGHEDRIKTYAESQTYKELVDTMVTVFNALS